MRPLGVVNPREVIEALLLLEEVEGGWSGSLLLEGEVHALVAAVLLRVARLDALDRDAEPEPPHREPGQSEQGIAGGNGRTVVGADCRGQAELLEGAFEDGEGEVGTGGGQALAGEQVAGSIVGDGEGIAVLAVAEHELSLVVGTP